MQSEKSVNVVLDTNTIVLALLSRDGKPAEVFVRVISGNVTNHISNEPRFTDYETLQVYPSKSDFVGLR